MITLSWWQLGLASLLVLALAATLSSARLNLTRPLLIAATRTVIQLSLIGLVLEALFSTTSPWWVGLMALVMLVAAGREVMARQNRRLRGHWSLSIGTGSMMLSSFCVTLLTLIAVVQPTPWYEPQYAIPLLGMLLGNTMTGIALGLDRLHEGAWHQRALIEGRLLLGQTGFEAMEDIRRGAMRSGTIPAINSMAAAGLVSLPGMMTGQILAGSSPVEAVKYQILLMFMIAAGTGFGTLLAVNWSCRRLFDDRARLRLDRLTGG